MEQRMKKVQSIEDLSQDEQGFSKIAYTIAAMTGSEAAMVVLVDPEGEVTVSALLKQGCAFLPQLAEALEHVAKQLRTQEVEAMNAKMPPGMATH